MHVSQAMPLHAVTQATSGPESATPDGESSFEAVVAALSRQGEGAGATPGETEGDGQAATGEVAGDTGAQGTSGPAVGLGENGPVAAPVVMIAEPAQAPAGKDAPLSEPAPPTGTIADPTRGDRAATGTAPLDRPRSQQGATHNGPIEGPVQAGPCAGQPLLATAEPNPSAAAGTGAATTHSADGAAPLATSGGEQPSPALAAGTWPDAATADRRASQDRPTTTGPDTAQDGTAPQRMHRADGQVAAPKGGLAPQPPFPHLAAAASGTDAPIPGASAGRRLGDTGETGLAAPVALSRDAATTGAVAAQLAGEQRQMPPPRGDTSPVETSGRADTPPAPLPSGIAGSAPAPSHGPTAPDAQQAANGKGAERPVETAAPESGPVESRDGSSATAPQTTPGGPTPAVGLTDTSTPAAPGLDRAFVADGAVEGEVLLSEPGLGEPRSPQRATLTGPPPLFQAPETPRLVTLQIAEVLRASGERAVELRLQPEELGRVQLTLSQDATGSMSVAINVERAETLDLLRRNIDLLAADLKDLGYGSVDFSFSGERGEDGSGTGPDQDGWHSAPASLPQDNTPGPLPMATARAGATGGAGIDMRL